MRITSLFSFAWLVLSVSGYASTGAYERMWYWYAYLLDGEVAGGKQIAPGCLKAKNVAAGGRCSWQQFIEYISAETPDQVPSALDNVDTTNLDQSTTALKNGGYTGVYKTNLIYSGIQGENAFPQIFQKVGEFCTNYIAASSNDVLKTNLQDATKGVLTQRVENIVNAWKPALTADGYNLQYKNIPTYPGSSDVVEYFDISKTAAESNVPVKTLKAKIAALKAADSTNHAANVEAARDASQGVSEVCKAGA